MCILSQLGLFHLSLKFILTLIPGSAQKVWHIQPLCVLLVHDSLAGFLILQKDRQKASVCEKNREGGRAKERERKISESWGERVNVIWKMKRGKGSESCVLSLVIWISNQSGFLAERERGSRGGGKESERAKMGMCERRRAIEGFLSPLSGLSPIATAA